MEDIRDSLLWAGWAEVFALAAAVMYLYVTGSFFPATVWVWINIGVVSIAAIVTLAFAIISAIVGIKKITRKGE